MVLLCFYAPKSHLLKIKEALFREGAGQYGNYDRCSWETSGWGQFRPLKGSTPYKGQKNKLCRVREYKVEMICKDPLIKKVLKRLIEVHPYEEPAYHTIRI